MIYFSCRKRESCGRTARRPSSRVGLAVSNQNLNASSIQVSGTVISVALAYDILQVGQVLENTIIVTVSS